MTFIPGPLPYPSEAEDGYASWGVVGEDVTAIREDDGTWTVSLCRDYSASPEVWRRIGYAALAAAQWADTSP